MEPEYICLPAELPSHRGARPALTMTPPDLGLGQKSLRSVVGSALTLGAFPQSVWPGGQAKEATSVRFRFGCPFSSKVTVHTRIPIATLFLHGD